MVRETVPLVVVTAEVVTEPVIELVMEVVTKTSANISMVKETLTQDQGTLTSSTNISTARKTATLELESVMEQTVKTQAKN